MKIFISGGGTGGHLYPAISIIELLLEKVKNVKIYYFGNDNSLEQRVIADIGIDVVFVPVSTTGFSHKSTKKKVISLINLFKSFLEVRSYFKDNKPDFVIGTGGYVTCPLILNAIVSKVPYAIQEQNIIPGFANQLFSKYAKYVFLGYNESKIFFRKKTNLLFTGNPIRKSFYTLMNSEKLSSNENLYSNEVVIIGGSGGAKSINLLMPVVVEKFKNHNVKFLHITGVRDYEKVLDLVKGKYYDNYEIQPYVHKIWDRLKNAKLAICRAGAITISEILFLKVPLILIPFPFAVRNHQYWNAYKYKKLGVAELVIDTELNEDILTTEISKFLNNQNFYNNIKNKLNTLKPNGASNIIVEKILEYNVNN